MNRARRLFIATVVAATSLIASTAVAIAADAQLQAPRSVSRAASFQFTATGMTPNAKIDVFVQLEDYVGTTVDRSRSNPSGTRRSRPTPRAT